MIAGAAVAVRRRSPRGPVLLVVPALAVFVVLFVAPMAMLVVQSFSAYSYVSRDASRNFLTFDHYAKILTDPYYVKVLWNTLRLGILTVAATLVVGFPYAYLLQLVSGRVRAFLVFALLAPLLVSAVVRSFGWMTVLSTDGLVNQALQMLGITSEPMRLLFTEGAVIAGFTQILLVYMVIPISESLRVIDPQVRLAASTLGASGLQTLRRVTLPLTMPGIIAGSILVFSVSTSSFVTPSLLGGGGVVVMSGVVLNVNLVQVDWPFGSALALGTFIVSTGIVILASRRAERGPGAGFAG